METKLARISQLSKENTDMVFTSLGHLINQEMLKSCHTQMDGTKAVGIDGITKEEYGRDLEKNLNDLVERLKRKSYRLKPARLVEIPKDNGKLRPLSIYCYEDKLVQEALRRILEAVFEPMFYDEMMGFRPNRGCNKAIRKLNIMLERKPTNYVLDADIKGFFQHLDHEWIVRFIESKIKDPNILRLVRRMLKAGIMNSYEFEDIQSAERKQRNHIAALHIINAGTVYAVILHKKWFCAKGSDGMNRIHVPKQKNRLLFLRMRPRSLRFLSYVLAERLREYMCFIK